MKVILLERIWINGTTKIVSRSYHAVVGMDSSTGCNSSEVVHRW